MTSFFELALGEVVERYGPLLDRVTIVLPDQNALPAFRQAAADYGRRHKQPILLPQLTTLHALGMRIANARIPRRLVLLAELHQIFQSMGEGPLQQTFDKARPMLTTILADFDELDGQLLDADLLYRSLREQTEITVQFSDYATEEEVAIIQEYWRHFTAKRIKENDRRQLDLYQKLPVAYHLFNDRLAELGLTYRGAMYREAIRVLRSQGWTADGPHVFIGFNKLNEAQLLMLDSFLDQKQGLLLFDELAPASHTQESRYYQSILQKRKAWDRHRDCIKWIAGEVSQPRLTVFHGSGSLLGAQAMVAELARFMDADSQGERPSTAILSKDTSQFGLLHAALLRSGLSVRNLHRISVAGSPLFSLLSSLFTLWMRLPGFRKTSALPYTWLQDTLAHPIVRALYKEEVETLEKQTHDNNIVLTSREGVAGIGMLSFLGRSHLVPTEFWRTILRELRDRAQSYAPDQLPAVRAAFHAINALVEQLTEETLSDPWTFWTLFAGELGGSPLPVDEEAADVTLGTLGAIQGHDFDFVIFLDANEGSLPAKLPRESYIPVPFRRLTGMTTVQDDAAQQAYLFYRTLKRTGSAFFYVNNSSDDIQHAEPSRYLEQLRTFGNHVIDDRYLQLEAQAHPGQPIVIEKTPELMTALNRFMVLNTGAAPEQLFPTRLSLYIQCPLLFYLQVLAGVRESSVLSEDMDGSRFGNIVHDSMEDLYKPYVSSRTLIQGEDVNGLLSQIPSIVRNRLMSEYAFTDADDIGDLGFVSVSEEVLVETVNRLILRDLDRTPFVIEKLEDKLNKRFALDITVEGKRVQIELNGKFDRVDRRQDGGLEVVDYKTSSRVSTAFKSWDDIFQYSDTQSTKEAFQILVYAWLLHKAEGETDVLPTVVRINDLYDRTATAENALFSVAKQPIDSIADVAPEIESRLKTLLEEIFDPAIPFRQTTQEKACTYCSFAGLCHRTQKPGF